VAYYPWCFLLATIAGVNYESLDDPALLRLIAAGDDGALEVIYDRYSRLVFSIALHLLGEPAAAEEVTLDVFTRLWQNADQYDPGRAQLNTWLTSISRHRAIDRLRRRDVRPEGHSLPLDEVNFVLAEHNPGPEDNAALHLQQERVRAALRELPEEQRRALALAYLRGLTQREIAERLGLPLGTVKTRIRLAMEKLRFLLREEVL
jgi:RNA polymerase sigma-70 factor, ECF subfamily